MPTITEYDSDGVPLQTESLHIIETTKTLHMDKLYYAAISTSELQYGLFRRNEVYEDSLSAFYTIESSHHATAAYTTTLGCQKNRHQGTYVDHA